MNHRPTTLIRLSSLSAFAMLGLLTAGDAAVPGTGTAKPGDEAAKPVELALRGQGRFTYLWFKVYDVRFYLPAGLAATAALDDHPRRLSFTWLRACTGKEQAQANVEYCGKRVGTAAKAEVDAGVAAFGKFWPDVKENDVIDLSYQPGIGTTILLNGRELGTTPGAAFSKVMFSIWLGDDPIDKDLRKKLLGIR